MIKINTLQKLSYIGIKEEGKDFRIIHSEILKSEWNKLPPGRYDIITSKRRKNKSNSQLGYLFAVIYPLFMKYAIDAGYEFECIEEVDLFCKQQFAGKDIINRNTGQVVTIPALKRDFKTIDMMTYIEKIRNYTAEYLSEYIPDPGEMFELNL